MITLKKQKAKLAHINIREEKHGEDDVLAMDLKITADMVNTFLNQIAPGLMLALYKGEDEQQPLLDDGHAPVLRFPGLEPLVMDLPEPGAKFTIHGAKKSDDIEFEAKIKKIQLECKEGGTVSIMFKAQVLPDPEPAGKLPIMMGTEVKVSVSKSTAQTDDSDGNADEDQE